MVDGSGVGVASGEVLAGEVDGSGVGAAVGAGLAGGLVGVAVGWGVGDVGEGCGWAGELACTGVPAPPAVGACIGLDGPLSQTLEPGATGAGAPGVGSGTGTVVAGTPVGSGLAVDAMGSGDVDVPGEGIQPRESPSLERATEAS